MSDTPSPRHAQWPAIQAGVARTRELDALDVRHGRLSPDALHLIPREMARRSRPVFPAAYRESPEGP